MSSRKPIDDLLEAVKRAEVAAHSAKNKSREGDAGVSAERSGKEKTKVQKAAEDVSSARD